MENIKTAKDILMKYSQMTSGEVWSDQIIERHRLSSSDDYSFCPYCVQRAKRGDAENWKQGLNPMWRLTHYIIFNVGQNKGRGTIEKKLYCDVCRKNISEEDYLKCRPVPKIITKEIDLTNIPKGSAIILR